MRISVSYRLPSSTPVVQNWARDHARDLSVSNSNTLTFLTVRTAPEIDVTEEPYEGWYRHEKRETREERDQLSWAAWGNEISFRHTEESLIRLFRDCGYSKAMAMRPPHSLNYTFYLCLPSPLGKSTALYRTSKL